MSTLVLIGTILRIVLIRIIAMSPFTIQNTAQLSTHLRSLRRRLKLTQAELGVRLGVEQARIGKIERNPGSISVDQLLELLAALQTRMLLDSGGARKQVAPGTAKVEW
jgi:HTH-type transcriptional regulator/antitoxin HipB